MPISEQKMKIVIENYFRNECDVNTTIRQAFERGFRIGVQKGQSVSVKRGEWIGCTNEESVDYECKCSVCGLTVFDDFARNYKYCPNCGAKMEEK